MDGIRQCANGHLSLDAANWVCPWCLLARCDEVNDQMAYIAGIVERGEGTPIAGGETIPAAVLRYVRSLEALREENARLTRERDEAREDAKTLREGWDREEKLRRDRDAAYQKRVEELEQTTRKFGVVQEELFRRAEAAEAKLATMVAWCRHAPDQWVMRKDVLYVLAAAKGE